MANTTTINGRVIEITGLDADWYIDNDMPGFDAGLALESIVFKPSQANDVMVIKNSKNGVTADPEIVSWTVGGANEEQVIYLQGENYFPFIDISDCTLGTPEDARIMMHFK